jgi:hypothetical protein
MDSTPPFESWPGMETRPIKSKAEKKAEALAEHLTFDVAWERPPRGAWWVNFFGIR